MTTSSKGRVVLGSVFGNRLNLNGDQGNLLALKKYLEVAGFEVEVVGVGDTSAALNAHFLLFGHGSQAAMNSIDARLEKMDWQVVTAAVPGLAVGSAVEWLAATNLLAPVKRRAERVSQFETGELGNLRVLGYRNSDSDLPNIQMHNQFIATMLHGPVLAKNPRLLHKAAQAAVKCAGLEFPKVAPETLSAWVEQLNQISERIWALETDETFVKLELV